MKAKLNIKILCKSFNICLTITMLISHVQLSSAQSVVANGAIKIVSTGAPHIVLNDISIKNEASSTVLSGTGLIVSFTGTGSSATTISSAAGYTTNPANVLINRAAGVTVQAPLTISNALTLTSGNLDLTTFDLDMAANSINNGSATSYVKTSSTGKLKRTVGTATGSVVFPIGKSSYNPALISNTGTQDNFSVRVYDYVSANGVEGGPQTTGDVVNRTWVVAEDQSGGSNVDLRLQWNTGEENQNFTYNPGFMNVVQFNGTTWQETGFSYQNNVPFSLGQGNISQFSSFTISTTGSVLPVELLNFQANCAGEGKVNVTWATASEHNSASFTVEKSRDGINWTVLATVAGAGNSTQMINYSVDDNNAAAGANYYRLTQTDIDGATETFNIAGANCGDNTPLTTVKVYPNPSAGDFYIDFTSEEIVGAAAISITDSRGSEIYSQSVMVEKGSNVFHIEQLDAAPGLYYIKVSNGTATSNIVKHSLR